MNVSGLRLALVCGTCCLLGWPSLADARFLQVDPVGYKDQTNLYAYVGNDPVNLFDPTGERAQIRVWDDNVVEVRIDIRYTNRSSNPNAAQVWSSNIETRMSGQIGRYNVGTQVRQVGPERTENERMVNRIMIVDGPTDGATPGHAGHSYVINSREGMWTNADLTGQAMTQADGSQTRAGKMADTPAHEGGHLLGLPDRGPGGGLMNAGPGNRLIESDVDQAIANRNGVNRVSQCVRSTGTCSPP